MSENYIVSARKYRPSTFKSVVGQDHITHTLQNSIISNRIAHAYLFTGPRGIGKTTCARILAKAINCEKISPEGEPCNSCPSCIIFNEQRSLNIYELDAASNNSVDDIRMLVDQVRFAPQAGKYKVYIIDEVHMLSTSAFNAFLKTLEEPPSYAIFILATTEKNKIIPTILSRCQIFDFNRIQIKDIANHLKYIAAEEHIEFEDEALHIIAQKADGALRDGLSIFDRIVSFSGSKVSYDFVIKNLNIIDYDYYFKATDCILAKDTSEILHIINQIVQAGFDLQDFLYGMSDHIRNLLVAKTPGTLSLLDLPDSLKGRYSAQCMKIQMAHLLSSLNILNQFCLSFRESKNQRLHTELALLKLCHLSDAIHLSRQIATAPEKKNLNPEPSSPPVQHKATTTATKLNIGNNGLNLVNIKEQRQKEDEEKQKQIQKRAEELNKIENPGKTDPEEFKKAFTEYIELYWKDKKISLYNCVKEKEPVFVSEDTVVLTFPHDAMTEMFLKVKTDLSDYLNKKYHIFDLKMECVVEAPTEEEQRKYLINPKDKFNAMKEINPELENLQQKFGLQPES
jgi:DNA polymerase III subunit gamma/tau